MDRGVQYFLRGWSGSPDVAAVAAAPEEDLLKAWEGSATTAARATSRPAARVIMEHHGGNFPTSYADILALPEGTKVIVMAPLVELQKGTHLDRFKKLKAEGFVRVRVDGQLYGMEDIPALDKNKKHTIDLVIDRLVIKDGIRGRLADSVELALRYGEGRIIVNEPDKEPTATRCTPRNPSARSAKSACPHPARSSFLQQPAEPARAAPGSAPWSTSSPCSSRPTAACP